MPNKENYGKIYVVSGPSGSGKTTLLKILRLRKEFRLSLIKITTSTTRAPRRGESNGKDYWFLKREDFLNRLHNAEFVETKEIFGEYYGVPRKDLQEAIASGKDVLLCVDVRGALSIRKVFPKNSVLIFISAPEFEHLGERLRLRSTEHKEAQDMRLKVAREEMGYIKYYDYVIINDTLPRALHRISSIIVAERLKVKK